MVAAEEELVAAMAAAEEELVAVMTAAEDELAEVVGAVEEVEAEDEAGGEVKVEDGTIIIPKRNLRHRSHCSIATVVGSPIIEPPNWNGEEGSGDGERDLARIILKAVLRSGVMCGQLMER
jgi:hypothetical protein